jgi:transposase-like protein
MAMVTCPECDSGIRLGRRPKAGQQFLCPHCSALLQVNSVRPLLVDWSYDYVGETPERSLDEVLSGKAGAASSLS